ncbi:hypothetical protein I8752_25585 [Nostocaceae cyanobacterium CENA369]|uniref:Uncharacterized protein n=1 Tax=Dendronalium phyllosphericum CENA369 TaxID=1725256 RepID=A0A8J7IJQ5_9NOST|nr:hypothetical protein [Dendronalium phyllosphericum]MBH8576302.1 hypothetical protein [Dendronalium phyllosphericum CENA369]
MRSPIEFDPSDDAIVDSAKNTIKIANHGFTTGQTLYYQVDPTVSTTASLPYNLSFEPETAVDVTNDQITVESHGLQTGDTVTYEIGYLGESATAIGGLTASATYKVQVVYMARTA